MSDQATGLENWEDIAMVDKMTEGIESGARGRTTKKRGIIKDSKKS